MALSYNLYVYNDKDTTWHVGEDTKEMNEYGRCCVHLRADGDELEAIRDQFSNIPMHRTARVVRWEGDMAAFIAMNLKNSC